MPRVAPLPREELPELEPFSAVIDTLATELGAGPLAFAGERLALRGWEVDEHRAG